jgi:hypothetical protein
MSDTPNTHAQSKIFTYRCVALCLSGISAYFAFSAGHSTGSWFQHFVSSVMISQFFAICSIGLLASVRSRIGWIATYKDSAAILTVLFLLPAQFMTLSIPGAANVVIR